MGKNSQIPLFFEIINVLPLFKKYLVMYPFFKLEFDMELKFTKIKFLKKVHLELEFMELKFLAIYNLLPVFQTLSLPFPHVTLTKER